MARLPSVQDIRQPTPSAGEAVNFPRGTGPSGVEGQALAKAGDALFQAGERIQNREDAIEFSNTIANVNRLSLDFMRKSNTEGDLSNKEYRAEVFQGLRKIYGDANEGFSGSRDAKARLEVRLTGLHAKAVGVLSGAANIIAVDRLEKNLDSDLQPILDKVRTSTQNIGTGGHTITNLLEDIDEAFIEAEELLLDVAGGLEPIREDDLRRLRANKIADVVFQSLLERGDADTAEVILLKTPRISNALTPGTRESIRGQIAQIRFDQDEMARRFRDAESLAKAAGVEFTPEMKRRFFELQLGFTEATATDLPKTKEAFNTATNQPQFATEAQIAEDPNLVPPRGGPKDEKITSSQRLAAGFALRVKQADVIIDEVGAQFTGIGSGAAEFLPQRIKSEDRQLFEQAQRNFTNAVLRRESGAAIAPSEFDSAEIQYFPRPGDGPKVIQQKKQNRQTVINSLELEAGPAFEQLERTVSTTVTIQGKPVVVGTIVTNSKGQKGRVEQDGSITVLE